MDDSTLVEFFTDILSHTADKQLDLENLIGHHTQLKQKNASFCMSKAELKKFFQKYNFIFKIDNKEIVLLLESNVASAKSVKVFSHHDDSLSETSSQSEVPQPKDQVSSSIGRFICVLKYYLKIISTGWAKLLAIFWNCIYSIFSHGQCAENMYQNLREVPFKKGDMINFYSVNNEFITHAWLGKKPKTTNMKNVQNGEDGESSVPVTSGSSYSSWSSTKDELVSPSKNDVLPENEVDIVFERASASLGNWNDAKRADGVCCKKAFINGEKGTAVGVIGTYGFIRQQSMPKGKDKITFFQKNAIRNWPRCASRLEEILKEGQHVWYVVISREKEEEKSNLLALHVWMSPCCRNMMCCSEAELKAQDDWLMENTVPWHEMFKAFGNKGTLYPHSLTEATVVGEGNERVLALRSVVFGSDYQTLDEKAWILGSRSKVTYNAISDSDCSATVACLDDKIPPSISDAACDEHLSSELMFRYGNTVTINIIRNSVAVNELPQVQDVVVSSGSASDSGCDSIYDSSDKEIPLQASHASGTTYPDAETNLVQLFTCDCDDDDINQETLRDNLNDPQRKPSFAEGWETLVDNDNDDDDDNSLFQFPAEEEHSENSKLSVCPKRETDVKLAAELEEVACATATSPLELQGPVSHCVADHNAARTTMEASKRFKEAAENLGAFSVHVDYIFSDLLPGIATCVLENISENSSASTRHQLVDAIADVGRKVFSTKNQEFTVEHGRISLPPTAEETLSKNVQIKHRESWTQTEEELLVVAAQTSSAALSSLKQKNNHQTQTYMTGRMYFSDIYHEN